jgi:lysophospholipase L1-like esterase
MANTMSTTENTALIPVPQLEKDGYDWYARHEEILAIKHQVDPEVIWIGDSITHEWGGVPRTGLRTTGEETMSTMLGEYRMLNLGFGWDRIQNVLWRLDHGEIEGLRAKVVVIHIGSNNTGIGNARVNTSEEIAEGVWAVCRRVRRQLPDARILLMAIFPRCETVDDPKRVCLREANRLLEAQVSVDPAIQWIDIGPQFLDENGRMLPGMTRDFCHPTEAGYRIWAAAVRPYIQAACRRD